MQYHKQDLLWNANDEIPTGSCYPTVIACLLDLPVNKVPYINLLYFRTQKEKDNLSLYRKMRFLKGKDYADPSVEKHSIENHDYHLSMQMNLWHEAIQIFLASHGYYEDYIADMDKWLSENPGVPYMASGMSARGVQHIVICQDGKLLHDPHPSNSGLEPNQTITFTYLEKISNYAVYGKYYLTTISE